MQILKSSYSSASNLTEATVEVTTTISPGVKKVDGVYMISLSGYVEPGSEAMYEACLEKLEQAGINLMPF